MTFSFIAALGGFGFVVIAIVVNVVYHREKLPLPTSGGNVPETLEAFAGAGPGLKWSSALAPASWVCLTIFAAGLLWEMWTTASGARVWALVGFAGVLMQNVSFAGVEALRLAVAESAVLARSAVPGLWALSIALFGFNQVFLAAALVGYSVTGVSDGLFPTWHAAIGFVSALLLFISASATPYRIRRPVSSGLIGLVGWLGWITWTVICSVLLL